MFTYKFLLCVVVASVSLGNVQGFLGKDDMHKMHESFGAAMTECLTKHSIEKDDLMEAKKNNDLSSIDPCFFKCMMTETSMEKDGKFQLEPTKKKIQEMIPDEEKAEKITKMMETCLEENGEDIGEGDEACEKAKLMMLCFEKQKTSMD